MRDYKTKPGYIHLNHQSGESVTSEEFASHLKDRKDRNQIESENFEDFKANLKTCSQEQIFTLFMDYYDMLRSFPYEESYDTRRHLDILRPLIDISTTTGFAMNKEETEALYQDFVIVEQPGEKSKSVWVNVEQEKRS